MKISRSTALWAVTGAVGISVLGGATLATAETVTPSPTPSVTAEAAYESALGTIGVTSASQLVTEFPSERTLGIWPTADGGRLAWKVVVSARAPVGLWEVIVDANTGEAIEPPLNRMCTVDGPGKVFTPNPVVSSGINNLTDQKPDFADFNYPISGIGRFFYVGARLSLEDLFN